MTLLTCEEDGQTWTVDTERISGWDAITYRQTMGEHLEAALVTLLEKQPNIAMAVDRAIVRWLWVRQNQDASATIASVALRVPAVLGADSSEVADDAQDAGDQRQGSE